MTSATLMDYVRSNVTAASYFDATFPDVRWPSTGEGRITCPFHADGKTPSLSLNRDSGKWYCHGCGVGGNSIVSFYAKLNSVNPQTAARQLYDRFIRPTIDEQQIARWQQILRESPSAMAYLVKERFLSESIIEQYELGFDGRRIIIPIRDEFGLCVNAKKYDPLHKEHGAAKMIHHRSRSDNREFGSTAMIYPLSVLLNTPIDSTIVVQEGEFDTLFLLSRGLPAVTTTNGSKTWPVQYNERFRGRRVVLAGDNDDAGRKYRERIIREIGKIVIELRQRELCPADYGHDDTDWYRKDQITHEPGFFRSITDKAERLIVNDPAQIANAGADSVPLDHASKAEWFNKRIKVIALVTGKDTAPYMLPRKFRVTCERTCDSCPLADSTKPFREGQVDPSDPKALELVDAPAREIRKMMLGRCGMKDKSECKVKVDVVDTFNLEKLLLIPTLESHGGQYVMRDAYLIGHGIYSNRAYEFEGQTLPFPRDQHVTHLFDVAKPVQDEIDTFSLTPELHEKLKVFRPKSIKMIAHLMAIAEWQSRNVTKIRERPDMHVAVDLAFHSAHAFEFNGEYLARGMLDILILGDTRCGKGYVTEGLVRYYRLGEVASGENCSFAGLIGGLQQVGKRWLVTWGVVPLNHGRLVVVDEASSLSEADFGKMSRVRSEGVAEISKIIRESTRANTRIVWLSNPRSGRRIADFNNGIQAVKELVGANEDISRFDFALVVATDEVPSEIINVPAEEHNALSADASQYPPGLCRSLILWAWSRRPDQIKFTQEATNEIIRQSIVFGNTYSGNIPLVQSENIRLKIAKLSVAVAARTFSSDDSGEHIVVKPTHVECACSFLRMIYSKPSMGYDVFSRRLHKSTTIQEPDQLDKVFNALGASAPAVFIGLIDGYRITPESLADYAGDVDSARVFIGELVRLKCLTRLESGHYLKNPAFASWLRNRKAVSGASRPKNASSASNGEAHSERRNGQSAGRRNEPTGLRREVTNGEHSADMREGAGGAAS